MQCSICASGELEQHPGDKKLEVGVLYGSMVMSVGICTTIQVRKCRVTVTRNQLIFVCSGTARCVSFSAITVVKVR